MWGATAAVCVIPFSRKFQSTRPVWGATVNYQGYPLFFKISIHAPRVGRDLIEMLEEDDEEYFNPRAPCGARPSSYSVL